jgi:hypothetical protein
MEQEEVKMVAWLCLEAGLHSRDNSWIGRKELDADDLEGISDTLEGFFPAFADKSVCEREEFVRNLVTTTAEATIQEAIILSAPTMSNLPALCMEEVISFSDLKTYCALGDVMCSACL